MAMITAPGLPAAALRPPVIASARAADLRVFLFLLAHLPAALLFRSFEQLALLHSLGALALTLWWATAGNRPRRAVYAMAYIGACDVWWRMTDASLFWEYAKYSVALVAVALLLRLRADRGRGWPAALYFLLLLPSATITIERLSLFWARDALSFNLSGPLALMATALLFSALPAGAIQPRTLLIAILGPVLGIAAIASHSTLTASSIVFASESNVVTSGGFGPNQVSATLGLGALIAFWLALQHGSALSRGLFIGIAVGLSAQALLTFSRGGVISAAVCVGFLAVHYIRQPRVRGTLFVVLCIFVIAITTYVVPRLNEWTGGALGRRYADTDPGLRQSIVEEDLRLWRQNPILGVGPGMAKYHRLARMGVELAAHTEFTRMLAEHGIFGAGAIAVLLWIVAAAYFRAPSLPEKAWVSAFAAWAFLEMSHSAMRIASISLMIGLSTLWWPGRSPGPAARR